MTVEITIKIRDGDTLIADAVSCRKTETGEIGWYDRVTEKFHPMPTSTPEISGGYLQWVETGVQYIDTGIKPANFCNCAADTVEVVRCRDCDVPHNKWTGCPMLNGLVTPPDFYCGFGERREENA